ncbi:unnamed protein product (macronuclear) [Paramecium tetraurelia]|uniref:Uncharacterized protein n=1 Tax=Paramecium tetraurelia TaxID=5888 RepID=A0EBB4_PARTE|nr:uncharacterized protein GSPATT00025315001 [Paramecium tetraurelia]CAK92581.1 unnamed protein product [Paramecium tetraurelia]|eukprot:XP_001459978.1 hypothetical protein (macronuclear) [Paramecium tetraurelia strain d4-2]
MEPFKICLVGHSASGKSSILAALQNKAFNPYIPQTIQSNCWKYTHQNRSFKIYDTSGLDKFQKSTINCLKNSNLIIICFDSSSKRAQIHVEQWLNIVRTYKSVTPIVFIGTKTDKALKQQNEYMQRLRERYPFYLTSASNPQGVKDVFRNIEQNLIIPNLVVERVQIRRREDEEVKSGWFCFC